MDKLLPETCIKSQQSNASKTKCQYAFEYFKHETLIVIMWKRCMYVGCVHVYVCRGQRSTSGLLLYCPSVFETVSESRASTWLGQLASSTSGSACLYPSPSTGVYSHSWLPCGCLRSGLCSSCLLKRLLSSENIF